MTFLHHIFILHHFSSFHHLIFFLSLILSSSLSTPLALGHFGWFPVWVVTPLIHPLFLRQEALLDIYLLLPDQPFCFCILDLGARFMFKWRLHFFHFLQEFLLEARFLWISWFLEQGSRSLYICASFFLPLLLVHYERRIRTSERVEEDCERETWRVRAELGEQGWFSASVF